MVIGMISDGILEENTGLNENCAFMSIMKIYVNELQDMIEEI